MRSERIISEELIFEEIRLVEGAAHFGARNRAATCMFVVIAKQKFSAPAEMATTLLKPAGGVGG